MSKNQNKVCAEIATLQFAGLCDEIDRALWLAFLADDTSPEAVVAWCSEYGITITPEAAAEVTKQYAKKFGA